MTEQATVSLLRWLRRQLRQATPQREHLEAAVANDDPTEARRVLEAAGGPVPSPAATIDLRDHAPEGEPEIGRVIAPGATRLTRGAHPSRLDTLLASAIESAVDDTFAGRASA